MMVGDSTPFIISKRETACIKYPDGPLLVLSSEGHAALVCLSKVMEEGTYDDAVHRKSTFTGHHQLIYLKRMVYKSAFVLVMIVAACLCVVAATHELYDLVYARPVNCLEYADYSIHLSVQ